MQTEGLVFSGRAGAYAGGLWFPSDRRANSDRASITHCTANPVRTAASHQYTFAYSHADVSTNCCVHRDVDARAAREHNPGRLTLADGVTYAGWGDLQI
jgi:hypothetical protein